MSPRGLRTSPRVGPGVKGAGGRPIFGTSPGTKAATCRRRTASQAASLWGAATVLTTRGPQGGGGRPPLAAPSTRAAATARTRFFASGSGARGTGSARCAASGRGPGRRSTFCLLIWRAIIEESQRSSRPRGWQSRHSTMKESNSCSSNPSGQVSFQWDNGACAWNRRGSSLHFRPPLLLRSCSCSCHACRHFLHSPRSRWWAGSASRWWAHRYTTWSRSYTLESS